MNAATDERFPAWCSGKGKRGEGILSGQITSVVADDHPVVAASVHLALEKAGVKVLEVVSTGEAALEAIGRLKPLVAVVDLHMPDMHGTDVVRRAKQLSPKTRCVIFSAFSSRAEVDQVFDVGAKGFVAKDSPLSDVVRAVMAVTDGKAYVDPVVGGRYAHTDETEELTPRERDILRLLAQGMTNEDIAKDIHISTETVRSHLNHAMRKLGAHTRTHTVVIAIRRGLIN